MTTMLLSSNRLVSLLIITATLALCASVHANDAEQLYKSGRYEEAAQVWQKELEANPDNARLKHNLSAAYYKLGKLEEAEAYIDDAIDNSTIGMQQQLFYNRANTRFQRGQDLLESQKPKEAVTAWEKAVTDYDNALELDADDADASHNRTIVKSALDKLKQELEQQEQEQNQQQNQQQNQDQKQQEQDQEQNDKQKQDKQDSPKNEQNQEQEDKNQSSDSDSSQDPNQNDRQKDDAKDRQDSNTESDTSEGNNGDDKEGSTEPNQPQENQSSQQADQEPIQSEKQEPQNGTDQGEKGEQQEGSKGNTGGAAEDSSGKNGKQEQLIPGAMRIEEARKLLESMKGHERKLPLRALEGKAGRAYTPQIKEW